MGLLLTLASLFMAVNAL